MKKKKTNKYKPEDKLITLDSMLELYKKGTPVFELFQEMRNDLEDYYNSEHYIEASVSEKQGS